MAPRFILAVILFLICLSPLASIAQSGGLGNMAVEELAKRGEGARATRQHAKPPQHAKVRGKAASGVGRAERQTAGRRQTVSATGMVRRAAPSQEDVLVGRVGSVGRGARDGSILVGRVGNGSGTGGSSFGDQLLGSVISGVQNGVRDGLANNSGYSIPTRRQKAQGQAQASRRNSQGGAGATGGQDPAGGRVHNPCAIDYISKNPKSCYNY